MRIVELSLLAVTFASIVWGVLRFFAPPSRGGWKAVAVASVAVAGLVNQVFVTWHAQTGWWRPVLAAGLYSTSLWIFWHAVRACGRRRLTAIFEKDAPVHLVTNGPYRFVRHPFYASYSLFWLAGWMSSGAISAALVAGTMFTIYVFAARAEESKFAKSRLGTAYLQYRGRTGLMFPWMLKRVDRYQSFDALSDERVAGTGNK